MLQLIAFASLVTLLSALFIAVKARFFARFKRGFGAMLAVALVVAGVTTAVVLCTWAYSEAKHIVIAEQVNAISSDADIAQHSLELDIHTTVSKLDNVAKAELVERALSEPQQVVSLLGTIQSFNRRVLQLSIFDRNGKLILSNSGQATKEPPNHVAVNYALQGKSYVSEPHVSKTFNREVMALSVPCENAIGEVEGVMTMRYDLQSAMQEAISGLGFGKTGYAVFVDMNGRVLAHPHEARVGTSIADSEMFKEAQKAGVGSFIGNNLAGEKRLFVYRQIPSPATRGGAAHASFGDELRRGDGAGLPHGKDVWPGDRCDRNHLDFLRPGAFASPPSRSASYSAS